MNQEKKCSCYKENGHHVIPCPNPIALPTPPAQEEKRHVSKCCLSGFIAHESGYYNCNACKENCDVFVPPQQKEPETNYRKRGEPIDFDKLKGIAADMKEPETWEETKYKGIDEPYYKGPGEHSVRDLEKICDQYKEFCYQRQIWFQTARTEAEARGREIEREEIDTRFLNRARMVVREGKPDEWHITKQEWNEVIKYE